MRTMKEEEERRGGDIAFFRVKGTLEDYLYAVLSPKDVDYVARELEKAASISEREFFVTTARLKREEALVEVDTFREFDFRHDES